MRLVEATFPLIEVNTTSEYEMAFLKLIPRDVKEKFRRFLGLSDLKGRNLPKIHNLMYYPARIPPSAARSVTLASILDSSVEKESFLKALGFERMRELAKRSKVLVTLFMVNPERDLISKHLNGSAESYVIVDPMAGGGSIPLEAKRLGFTVIAGDYNPVAYLLLRGTIEFPAKYGTRLYHLVNEEAKRLIDYLKKELGQYYRKEGKCYIIVPSVEHECGATIPLVKEMALLKGRVYVTWVKDLEKRRIVFKVSDTPGPPLTICPFCGRPLSIENLRRAWIRNHKEFIDRLFQGDESVADEASKHYTIIATSITKTRYREPTEQDYAELVEAARALAKSAKEESLIEYLPVFEIPIDNEVFHEVRGEGLQFWHYLFTPRQLLFIYKVVSYIRRRTNELKKAYGELGVAMALYLALGLIKVMNYNTLLAQWDSSEGSIRDFVGSQYALSKRAGIGFDFVDGNVTFTLKWALEAEEEESGEDVESTAGGMLPVLKLLCESLAGMWHEGKDFVYLWDAREIDKVLPPGSVDLVNVDPPYYEQHDYAGVTEFFWVLLQTALKDVLDELFPMERVKLDWSPYDPVIPKNIEIKGSPPSVIGGVSRFGEEFKKFLDACAKVIKPDGLLVVWYSYGKLSGWEELFYRFYEAGYAVTKVWQVWTQSPQRRVALHTKAFFTSLVIVARPRARRELILDVNDVRLETEVSRRVRDSLLFILGTYGVEYLKEALVTSIADGLAGITLFDLPCESPPPDKLQYRRMLDRALEVSINTVIRELLKRAYERMPETSLDAVSRLYFVLLLASSMDPKSGRLHISHDFANRVSHVLGVPLLAVTFQGRRVGEGAADELLSPKDVASRGHQISRAIALIYKLTETWQRAGTRSAEEYAKEHSSHAPLALAIASLAWEKLGLPKTDLEKTVRDVLMKVVQ